MVEKCVSIDKKNIKVIEEALREHLGIERSEGPSMKYRIEDIEETIERVEEIKEQLYKLDRVKICWGKKSEVWSG